MDSSLRSGPSLIFAFYAGPSGPLYRLPCSSTMNTYVPATISTSNGSGGIMGGGSRPSSQQQHHHGGNGSRPAVMCSDALRGSSSLHSFSSVPAVSSLYTLSDQSSAAAMCTMPNDGVSSSAAIIPNGDHLGGHHRDEMSRGCHQLYWSSRSVPRIVSATNGGNTGAGTNHQQQQLLAPTRMMGNGQQQGWFISSNKFFIA